MAYKKWETVGADKEKASALSEEFGIDPFVSYLLVSRGISKEGQLQEFISDEVRLSDPFLLRDMDKAVGCIEAAIEAGEKITVFGDYDCDGVTATVLLFSFLQAMGADVDYYIPSRTEGYGMNTDALKQLCASGTKLFVTVDNGIASVKEAEYIYENGARLVVTDHHQIEEELPVCEAVVDPQRKENQIEFRDITGVGVALKLAAAISGSMDDVLYEYADLVAIGTVADLMPLLGENRVFVRVGLQKINSEPSCGIAALLEIAGYAEKKVDTSALAYGICPRINAAGRMESANCAAALLLCEDEDEAAECARVLEDSNRARREIESGISREIEENLSASAKAQCDRVIVAVGENYHKGVIGIAAAHVVQKYGKPTVVISTDESDTATASARSVQGFDIFKALSSMSGMFERFGGHALAAGFSIKKDKIPAFKEAINEYARQQYEIMPAPVLKIDCKISPKYLNLQLAKDLAVLEPCGTGNPTAVFALTGLTVSSLAPMGKTKQHMQLYCEKDGCRIRIIQFGVSPEEFPFEDGDIIDAAVNIEENVYEGRSTLSVKAVDIKKSGIDDERFLKEKDIYDLFITGALNDKSVYPDREDCAVIYRALKRRKTKKFTPEDLYFLLSNDKDLTYAKVCFALNAFTETGLAKKENGRYTYIDTNKKVNLEETKVMQYLKRRLSIA